MVTAAQKPEDAQVPMHLLRTCGNESLRTWMHWRTGTLGVTPESKQSLSHLNQEPLVLSGGWYCNDTAMNLIMLVWGEMVENF